jgi:energy-coupling factor transport system ATP-binding protein
LERLALKDLADFNPFTLSGGEQRRLSVAAALATSPDVLILDEPTFGQDPTTWRELVQLVLDERNQGRAIVVVSHDRRFVAAVANSKVQLERGRVVADDKGDIP